MKRKLYIFNPEHDLALANSDPNFSAPLSAVKFSKDVASLPLWYAEQGSCVFCESSDINWFKDMQQLFPYLNKTELCLSTNISTISEIQTWGWDEVVIKKLLKAGFCKYLMPDADKLEKIRELSHRRLAIITLKYLSSNAEFTGFVPEPALELSNIESADKFARNFNRTVFKAPWSGSGKGLKWVRGGMSDSHRGWCRNIISKQGSVIAEQVYDVVQDFAMEFNCTDGVSSFAGYSLFNTDKGIYRSSMLLSDSAILEKIVSQGITAELILRIQNLLNDFIKKNIAPFYTGALGIDMFLYEDNYEVKIHPCVEINLRMTMGLFARVFYDRFVSSQSEGLFYIDNFQNKTELLADHLNRIKEFPLKVEKGKILQGYLALNFIDKETCYRARVEIG